MKIKSNTLRINCFRRENVLFLGAPEFTTGAENAFCIMYNFLKENLDLKNAVNIEYQRAHRIRKKKTVEARPAILRFLRCPERELGSGRAREPESNSDELKSSQTNSS